MQNVRAMFAGGGTGGHIYPAIALAKEFLSRHSDANILFVGATRGMERELVPAAGFRLVTLEVTSFPRRLSFEQVRSGWRALKGVTRAMSVLRSFSPDIVVGTGGYAAGPLLMAAALLGYPTLIHEQNAYPSLTNRLLAKFVRGVAVSHAEAKAHFPPLRVRLTGNPLRSELFAVDRQRARRELRVHSEQKLLVVVGGSGGAQALNRAIMSAYAALEQTGVVVFHVAGKRDYAATLEVAQSFPADQIRVVDYAANLPEILVAADLVVSRAGGITAELAYLGKPAILIPLPTAPNDHQLHNARAAEKAGGAVLIEERFLNGQALAALINELLLDPARLAAMSRQSKTLAYPNATRDLCDFMEQIMLREA